MDFVNVKWVFKIKFKWKNRDGFIFVDWIWMNCYGNGVSIIYMYKCLLFCFFYCMFRKFNCMFFMNF